MTTWLAGCVDDGVLTYDCAVFPPAATSPFILPWSIGTTHRAFPHAAKYDPTLDDQYSVDVLMPIGTGILAMRDGVVALVEESFVDGDNARRHENYVIVEHEDGTVARYLHLTYGGAVFGVGDRVRQGEIIAYSGHTGSSTEPHLHVDVTGAVTDNQTLPLNFRNATTVPPLQPDLSCGLRYGVLYTAEPY